MLDEPASPPVLVFPDFDAANDGSHPLLLYSGSSQDGFGATLEHAQVGGDIHPIAYLSRS